MDRRAPAPRYSRANEVDFAELWNTFYRQKWLIVCSTLIFVVLAFFYLYTSSPAYRGSVSTLPPRGADIASLNFGRAAAKISEVDAEHVYDRFTTVLLSERLRRWFFDEYYVRSEAGESPRDRLWRRYMRDVRIGQPNPVQFPNVYEITVLHEDAAVASEWAHLLLLRAGELTRASLLADLRSKVQIRERELNAQIDLMRQAAADHRLDQVAKLREALVVAEAIGLEDPHPSGRLAPDGQAQPSDNALLYMRGSRAIQAEIDMLQNRESDDPFIPKLRELQEQLALLKVVGSGSRDLSVYTLDRAPVVAESPVDRQAVLLLLGAALAGLLLGLFIALVRNKLRLSAAEKHGPANNG